MGAAVMRTFRLYDFDGNRYNLTSKNHLFFYAVDGLGFEKKSQFQRIEDRFALLDDYISSLYILIIYQY